MEAHSRFRPGGRDGVGAEMAKVANYMLGLELRQRQESQDGVVHYTFRISPFGSQRTGMGPKVAGRVSKVEGGYPFAQEGVLVEFLAALRRRYPFLHLLTNDSQSDIPRDESHIDLSGGLIDSMFTRRFPNALVHMDYNRSGD